MKFYKKQLHPIIQFKGYLGYTEEHQLKHDDWWDEDHADVLMELWKEELSDGEKLILQERFVEVDPPEVKVADVKPNSFLGIKFATSEIGLDTVETYAHKLAESFPEANIIVLPDGEFEAIEDQEAALMILEHYIDVIKKEHRSPVDE